jgi:predicted Holliday junction resolvase-like endonuclease
MLTTIFLICVIIGILLYFKQSKNLKPLDEKILETATILLDKTIEKRNEAKSYLDEANKLNKQSTQRFKEVESIIVKNETLQRNVAELSLQSA